jgi:hypothetical protein
MKVDGDTTIGELTAFLNNEGLALEAHTGQFAAVRLSRKGAARTGLRFVTGHDIVDALQKAVEEYGKNRS